MPPQSLLVLAGLLLAPAPSVTQTASTGEIASITETQLAAFRPRLIGPAVAGGRVHDIEALPNDPSTIFVASASGGLWKTTNRGHTWRNVFSDQAVRTFGDVAIAPSDPNILYVGTGEQNNRQSSSWGNGVYRSDDGGETFRHVGLVETRHIGKVLIHPRDPEVAYVAALGNLWRGNEERGVYRTQDGGRTWERVLYVDEFTGAVDLVMDPQDPKILYAATYQRLRRTWGLNGGGPGSGIHRSVNGGDTWRELTNGIPLGDKGRIGLAISKSDPRILSALIEHADGADQGTYRSEDGGATWQRVNALDPRPMYYSGSSSTPRTHHVFMCLERPHTRVKTADVAFRRSPRRPHTTWVYTLTTTHSGSTPVTRTICTSNGQDCPTFPRHPSMTSSSIRERGIS